MKNIHFFLVVSMATFFLTCQNSKSSKETSSTESTTAVKEDIEQAVPSPKEKEDNIFYTWVDKLNIREVPNTKSKTIKVVASDTPLKFTGEESKHFESIVLRGVCYETSWLKVMTPNKTEGWVFGGAIRRKGESKGNEIMTDEVFDFPYFGSFNLKEWKKLSEKEEGGGDAEIITSSYKKGDQVLEISKVDVGDYGYGRIYKLRGTEHEILKERELHFSADPEMRELKETVKVFNVHPNRQYVRTQKMKKHHSQLNALPLMVDGAWVESEI